MIATLNNTKILWGPTIPFAWTINNHPFMATLGHRTHHGYKLKLKNNSVVICDMRKSEILVILIRPDNKEVINHYGHEWAKEGYPCPFNFYVAKHNHPQHINHIIVSALFRVDGPMFLFPFESTTKKKRIKRIPQ